MHRPFSQSSCEDCALARPRRSNMKEARRWQMIAFTGHTITTTIVATLWRKHRAGQIVQIVQAELYNTLRTPLRQHTWLRLTVSCIWTLFLPVTHPASIGNAVNMTSVCLREAKCSTPAFSVEPQSSPCLPAAYLIQKTSAP